jgi:hypothetical protein
VICPLEAARRKTLEEKFRHLKRNISATEDDEVLLSPADVFNDNPNSPGNKRDTQGEAERLYNAWKDSESLNRLGG